MLVSAIKEINEADVLGNSSKKKEYDKKLKDELKIKKKEDFKYHDDEFKVDKLKRLGNCIKKA